MSKEKDDLLFRILFWPLISMNDTIEKVHAGMDETAPDDPFLEEDKRAIGAHPTNPVECCADANPKTMLPNDT